MDILSQLFSIETKNLIIDEILLNLREGIISFFDTSLYFFKDNLYLNLIMHLQNFMNGQIINIIHNIIECMDNSFKNSFERKKFYFINKSNVDRCIVTIFGELRFKRTLYQNKFTGEYYFYIDEKLNLESYKSYDPIIRAILVNESVLSNPNKTSKNSPLNILDIHNNLNEKINKIPRQTIYRFKKETNIRKINYNEIPINKTLYIMADEKWIHEQDKRNSNKRKWIMSKCFVTFTGIEKKGKRNRLVGRHIFITSSKTPWKDFMDEIHLIYDFEKIETINLLSDAGTWILSGQEELRLYSHNKIVINTCEFHVKQKINRSTTDKELRIEIANIIYENEDKEKFIEEMDKLIEIKKTEERKQKVTEYKNYILKHWKGIINMKYSMCKSSMEAHIQHCIASNFSAVPKAYSKKNIETNLKLQEIYMNKINIMKYYLDTYNSDENYIYNDEFNVNYSIFEKSSSTLPIVSRSNPVSFVLYSYSYSKY